MNFLTFKSDLQSNFNKLQRGTLYKTDVDTDILYETYLKNFPEGTNKIYITNTEHDCSCCRQFIKTIGNVVAIVDGKLTSIWDIKTHPTYQPSTNAMRDLVQNSTIKDVFLHDTRYVGTDKNKALSPYEEVITFDHFFLQLARRHIQQEGTIASTAGELKSNKNVFEAGLNLITEDSLNTVIDLINQDSLYRGQEKLQIIKDFLSYKKTFKTLSREEKEVFCWGKICVVNMGVLKLKNSSIGELLLNLSSGNYTLEKAVSTYESMVAPQNYKRPKALITKSMIAQAEQEVKKLGLEASLYRRYAHIDDLTINNVIFADRTKTEVSSIFESLEKSVSVNEKKLSKIETVTIDVFEKDILPKLDTVEVLVNNDYENNFVSLIAPEIKGNKNLFLWDNNFSWSYKGEVADSIKEKVKKAGGDVTGVLRCSLNWFNRDDLDISVIEPGNRKIFYRNNLSTTGGRLDVDMNAGAPLTKDAVENITWPTKETMLEGKYEVVVHNFTRREAENTGFTIEIEHKNEIKTLNYKKCLAHKEQIVVATFNFSKTKGITWIKTLPEQNMSKTIWGIETNRFHKVKLITLSPNYWDSNKIGNKHWFFFLENCINPDETRGFYNEFLLPDLQRHRKVFEVLGSKIKVPESSEQLSGLGFSSTQRNEIILKVTGSFSRTIRVII